MTDDSMMDGWIHRPTKDQLIDGHEYVIDVGIVFKRRLVARWDARREEFLGPVAWVSLRDVTAVKP